MTGGRRRQAGEAQAKAQDFLRQWALVGGPTRLFSAIKRCYNRSRETLMNVVLPAHMDKPAFLAWVQGREGRYELANGRVVMMVGASRAHGLIVSNLIVVLYGQLDPREWTVIANFGLDAGEKTLRYPDVVVDRAGAAASDYTAAAPALIAEVLSPSTAEIDLGDKAAEYLQLRSLSAYLVFAQNEPKAWAWIRGSGKFPTTPNVITGYDKVIHVPALKLALPLGAVFAGIEAA
jgi:Uma2 family endonuclease